MCVQSKKKLKMERIRHLYGRAGFGLSPEEWQRKKNWGTSQAIDDLFEEADRAKRRWSPPAIENMDAELMEISKEAVVEKLEQDRKKVGQINADWVVRMADPAESALLERMALFWHGHFACRIVSPSMAVSMQNTLYQHALGNFRDLLVSIAKEPAMIRYLNNQQNRKQKPNENFARELMELFTLGRGHYSEMDVKEAARAFTGWSSDRNGNYVFRSFFHDYEEKSFLGKTGNFDGTDIIDTILEKKQTARFIAGKVCRYFVSSDIDESRIQEMASVLYESGYNIATLMRAILESEWFYENRYAGIKIKSPVDLIAGAMRSLGAEFSNPLAVVFLQKSLGQVLFNPPNVAGWPGDRAWIDNSTLMSRLHLAAYLLNQVAWGKKVKAEFEDKDNGTRDFADQKVITNLDPFKIWLKNATEKEVFEEIKNMLLPAYAPLDYKGFQQLQAGAPQPPELVTAILTTLMCLPEYQMC